MAEQANPRLLRLIFQARYKPKLDYFTLADRAAAALESDYPNWRRGPTGITLSNYAHRCVLTMGHESFAYCQDSSDTKLASKRLQHALQQLPSALKLKGYTRLGLRHLVLVPVAMKFESLVAVMTAKLYAETKPLRNALPHKTDDLFYRIDGSEQDRKFHVSIAPVHREEIGRKIVGNLATSGTIDPKKMRETMSQIEDDYPSVAVFYDVDVYTEATQITIESAPDFIGTAGKRIDQMVRETTDYMLDRMVDVE